MNAFVLTFQSSTFFRSNFFALLPQKVGKQVRLVNTYGPTETTIVATTCDLSSVATTNEVPIGKAIPQVQTYVVSPENSQLLPMGVAGELCIGGVGIARGYLNQPELTAQRFIANPYSTEPGARVYKTGDLVRYFPDGNLEFLGRIDSQVKIRGFRIELGEIEALLNQHSDIKESVVISREEMVENQRLIAYIVPKKENIKFVQSLRKYLKEHLPEYMIPAKFVMLNNLPLSANGKLDRQALPKPTNLSAEFAVNYVAPRNEIEKKIANIWQEVLQLEKVGMEDNFFDLGGHSLLVLQVQSKLQNVLNKNVSATDLFKYPNISSLANHLNQDKNKKDSFQGIRSRAEKQKAAVNYRIRMHNSKHE